MDMGSLLHQFLQQLINGISLGSIYALIALGYTMIYGILKLINFAHGDIYMLGAYFGFVATTMFGFSFLPAILFAMACAAVAGIIIERIAYRPMRNAPRIAILITAIGVSFLLEYGMMLIATPQPRTFPAVFSADVYHLGPLVINSQQVVILVSAIILIAGHSLLPIYTILFCQEDEVRFAAPKWICLSPVHRPVERVIPVLNRLPIPGSVLRRAYQFEVRPLR